MQENKGLFKHEPASGSPQREAVEHQGTRLTQCMILEAPSRYAGIMVVLNLQHREAHGTIPGIYVHKCIHAARNARVETVMSGTLHSERLLFITSLLFLPYHSWHFAPLGSRSFSWIIILNPRA